MVENLLIEILNYIHLCQGKSKWLQKIDTSYAEIQTKKCILKNCSKSKSEKILQVDKTRIYSPLKGAQKRRTPLKLLTGHFTLLH